MKAQNMHMKTNKHNSSSLFKIIINQGNEYGSEENSEDNDRLYAAAQ